MEKINGQERDDILPGEKNEEAGKGQEKRGIAELTQAGAENIDKVRDILFGNQVREFEARFTRLEELINKELNNTRDEMTLRFESLEKYIKSEVESLSEQIKTEQDERNESVEELTGKLNGATKTLEKKIVSLDEKLTKGQRDLRQQILDQSKSLTDEIQKKNKELTTMFEKAIQELNTDKTDRLALAALFMEMAMRLREEFEIPVEVK